MTTAQIPTLDAILAHLVQAALKEAPPTDDGRTATRFPIVVSPATRKSLDQVVVATGGSLAQIAGAIVDAVMAETVKESAASAGRT